jgi:hypothetical protein
MMSERESRERMAWWVLRCAAAACFVGHGVFGLIGKRDWLPFFGVVGIGPDLAWSLMLVVGIADILIGLSVLVGLNRALLLYMAVWALWTASLRPLTGLSVWEMVERAGNYGVPIALLVWTWDGWRAGSMAARLEFRDLKSRASQVSNVLAITTALLLIGHGGLALEGKPLLDKHLMVLGLPPVALAAQGWFEIVLGLVCGFTRSRSALVVALVWKLGTEFLFVVTGAWAWELLERGGSYGAPLALALLAGATEAVVRARNSLPRTSELRASP